MPCLQVKVTVISFSSFLFVFWRGFWGWGWERLLWQWCLQRLFLRPLVGENVQELLVAHVWSCSVLAASHGAALKKFPQVLLSTFHYFDGLQSWEHWILAGEVAAEQL